VGLVNGDRALHRAQSIVARDAIRVALARLAGQ
jgi:hypothetical protein